MSHEPLLGAENAFWVAEVRGQCTLTRTISTFTAENALNLEFDKMSVWDFWAENPDIQLPVAHNHCIATQQAQTPNYPN